MSKYANVIKMKITLVFLACFCFVFCNGCSVNNIEKDRLYFDFFGTTVYVNIYDTGGFFWQKQTAEKCFDEIENVLTDLSRDFSCESEDSFVYMFNNLSSGESISVNEEYKSVFNLAKSVYEETDGAFNPAVKYLVDLWGFSKRHSEIEFVKKENYDRDRNVDGSFNLPNSEYITAFKSLADFSKVSLENGYLIKNCESVTVNGITYNQKIDLSGIVKGYASEKIKDIIESYGYKHFYLSIGTSSMYLSTNLSNEPFDLGITDPKNPSGAPNKSIKVKDAFVSTSGTYQNCYTLSGKTYHHIINSKTGEPCETDILSATIVSSSGALSDALSTAVMVMGADEAKEFLDSNEQVISYVLICNDAVYEKLAC